MIKIAVTQGNNCVRFEFENQFLGDAMLFIQNCLETAGVGTEIHIVEEAE